MGDAAGGLAAGPAESPSPGPGLTPDPAPNEGRKTAAVSICRDGAKKPGRGSKKEKQASLKRCVIDFRGVLMSSRLTPRKRRQKNDHLSRWRK